MATQYDPAIIQQFADKLYSKANTIALVWAILGIVVGGVVGYKLGSVSDSTINGGIGADHSSAPMAISFIGAIVCGVIGFAIGTSRAFSLRLQAQIVLCQRKIEENTRQ